MKIGLVINPQSGVGGSVALKGSDGAELQELAKRRDGEPRGGKSCLLYTSDAADE